MVSKHVAENLSIALTSGQGQNREANCCIKVILHKSYTSGMPQPEKGQLEPDLGIVMTKSVDNLQRLNVNWSQCSFAVNVKQMYHLTEKDVNQHQFWVSQPGSRLDKRQCSIQMCA